jgi:hypothetical protein
MAHAGKRPGAGRKKGSVPLPKVNQEIKQELREIAREYYCEAIKALVKICETGKSESARDQRAASAARQRRGRPSRTPVRPSARASDIPL